MDSKKMQVSAELIERVLRMPPDMHIVPTIVEIEVQHPLLAELSSEFFSPNMRRVAQPHNRRQGDNIIEWYLGDIFLGEGRTP